MGLVGGQPLCLENCLQQHCSTKFSVTKEAKTLIPVVFSPLFHGVHDSLIS